VWKSTDYGLTWTGPINTGTNGDKVTGKNWGEAIWNSSPDTPPVLYATSGAALTGILRSRDGGVNWEHFINVFPSNINDRPNDVYMVDVDPYDADHIIIGYHEAPGVAESFDGGESWRNVTGNLPGGTSWYVFFINTGNAASTRTTWIGMPQVNSNGSPCAGTWRTSNSGSSWTKVENGCHPHGNSQIYQPDNDGILYIANDGGSQGDGVYRSTDYGQSFTHVGNDLPETNVWGTPNHVYSTYAWACGGCDKNNNFQIGPTTATGSWTYNEAPMDLGAKRADVTFDGSNYIVVAACWTAGVWRYVEP
jgi:hypothetical protein